MVRKLAPFQVNGTAVEGLHGTCRWATITCQALMSFGVNGPGFKPRTFGGGMRGSMCTYEV